MEQTALRGEPSGFGGWLVIPVIGFFVVIAYVMIVLFGFFIVWPYVQATITGNRPDANLIKLLTITSLALSVAVIITAFLCLYRIFFSQVGVKRIAVIHYLLLVVMGFSEDWIASLLSVTDEGGGHISSGVKYAIPSALLIGYFLRSKRIKNSFDRPPLSLIGKP